MKKEGHEATGYTKPIQESDFNLKSSLQTEASILTHTNSSRLPVDQSTVTFWEILQCLQLQIQFRTFTEFLINPQVEPLFESKVVFFLK